MSLFPALYISHGGGPCFFMDWSSLGPANTWDKMAAWLKQLGQTLPHLPKAVVVISAHWEESEFTVQTTPQPSLVFDYYGFPRHTYELTYPAPGEPRVALEIHKLLEKEGIFSRSNHERGFDHGVFVPFKLIYPNANVPIVQISLKQNLDPAEHLKLGRSIASLREQGVLIVGSGMSYHNLRELFAGSAAAGIVSEEFDEWLTQAVCTSDFKLRDQQLINWHHVPSARLAHPREEHLIPLMVVAGAAGNSLGKRIFNDRVMGASTSAFQFG